MTGTGHDPSPVSEMLLEYGRQLEADEMEIAIRKGTDFTVQVRQGMIEQLIESGSCGLSLKVIIDQRTATASTSDFSEDVLRHLTANAVERAKRSHRDPYAGLPEPLPVTTDIQALKLYDPNISEFPSSKKIEMARTVESVCLSDRRILQSHGASFHSSDSEFFLVNSRGFHGSYKKTKVSCGVYVQVGEKDRLFDEGWSDASRNLEGLMPPEEIARMAVQRATRMLNARKIRTRNAPVVFEFTTASELLGFLYNCLDGHLIYLRQSCMSDRLGQPIASADVNVVDDGLIPGGPGTRPFDSDGVATRKTCVIEKGVLKTYLTDTYASKKLGTSSTGNASGPNNFYMVPGPYSPEEIIRSVDQGLLLAGTLGQGMSAATGELSRGAYGLWIEGGEIAFPVAEITVSGNLGGLLKNIELVGNDLKLKGSVSSPTIKVGEMTIGGKVR